MRAVTITPGKSGSLRLDEVAEPPPEPGTVLVRTLAIGVCGTDRELIEGAYGEAPPGHHRLVIGHESLGCVIDAPAQSGFAAGDAVVGIVRHPDPEPCANCAVGEWDMCRNGLYTERGIKQADGFCAERWRSMPGFLVKVEPSLGLAAVLLEPASIVAKAWEHIEAIGRRARFEPHTVLVTGAGPIGLLAALMGVQRGYKVHVQDRHATGPKPDLVRDLGAQYLLAARRQYDVILECTGAPALIREVLSLTAPDRIVCLTGVSPGQSNAMIDVAPLNQSLVLGNGVIFGSVNANRRHYEAAAQALARADRSWLDRLIARRVNLEKWEQAYEQRGDDIKTVLTFED
jgi:threonine dehydrogenase-like Zn-dependent dehydrogenase